jgi:hypothetical protein
VKTTWGALAIGPVETALFIEASRVTKAIIDPENRTARRAFLAIAGIKVACGVAAWLVADFVAQPG